MSNGKATHETMKRKLLDLEDPNVISKKSKFTHTQSSASGIILNNDALVERPAGDARSVLSNEDNLLQNLNPASLPVQAIQIPRKLVTFSAWMRAMRRRNRGKPFKGDHEMDIITKKSTEREPRLMENDGNLTPMQSSHSAGPSMPAERKAPAMTAHEASPLAPGRCKSFAASLASLKKPGELAKFNARFDEFLTNIPDNYVLPPLRYMLHNGEELSKKTLWTDLVPMMSIEGNPKRFRCPAVECKKGIASSIEMVQSHLLVECTIAPPKLYWKIKKAYDDMPEEDKPKFKVPKGYNLRPL